MHDLLALRELRALALELEPEVVQLNSSKAGTLVRVALAGTGIPVAFTAHGWAFSGRQGLDGTAWTAIERATAAVTRFQELYEAEWLSGMRAKLGLVTEEPEDGALVDDLLDWMQGRAADFTNTFRALSSRTLAEPMARADESFGAWYARLEARWARQPPLAATR